MQSHCLSLLLTLFALSASACADLNTSLANLPATAHDLESRTAIARAVKKPLSAIQLAPLETALDSPAELGALAEASILSPDQQLWFAPTPAAQREYFALIQAREALPDNQLLSHATIALSKGGLVTVGGFLDAGFSCGLDPITGQIALGITQGADGNTYWPPLNESPPEYAPTVRFLLDPGEPVVLTLAERDDRTYWVVYKARAMDDRPGYFDLSVRIHELRDPGAPDHYANLSTREFDSRYDTFEGFTNSRRDSGE